MPLGAMLLDSSLSAAAQQPPADTHKTLSTVVITEKVEAPEGKDAYRATGTSIGKGKQQLRDIPQSVTLVTEKLVDDRNLDTLKDVLHNTAGVTLPPRCLAAAPRVAQSTRSAKFHATRMRTRSPPHWAVTTTAESPATSTSRPAKTAPCASTPWPPRLTTMARVAAWTNAALRRTTASALAHPTSFWSASTAWKTTTASSTGCRGSSQWLRLQRRHGPIYNGQPYSPLRGRHRTQNRHPTR